MFEKRFRSGRTSRTTATVTLNGKAVGHLGMMAGGSCCFVNASTVDDRLAFVAHADNLDAALVELNKAAALFGLRAE